MSIRSKERLYRVRVIVEFAAAHHIRGYQGDCARPHGHNYKVEVEASTPVLNSIGIAADFKVLKRLTKELMGRFDHQDVNKIPPFDELNPTAEVMARYFFEQLEPEMKRNPETENLSLETVTVWENERCSASFGN